MKQTIFLILCTLLLNVKAQITLEHIYPNANFSTVIPEGQLKAVHLTGAGYKYWTIDTLNNSGTITVYNLNHSLYKTINIPTQPTPNNSWSVKYLSDELFNVDSTDIEYMTIGSYIGSMMYVYYIRIYDETGTVLFSKDSVGLGNYTCTTGLSLPAIFNSSSGVKMILYRSVDNPYYSPDNNAFVYSLPGVLPCNDCNNGTMNGIILQETNNNMNISNPYPNPTNHTTKINYQLPDGVNNGEIVFYDLTGKEVTRFKVDRTFNYIQLTTDDLTSGTYYYQLQTHGQNSSGKKMVVIK